jgi:xanthine dehydrogenase YagR molybdenum-binding subunit
MRAPGGPAAFFALECAIDELAHALGKDPVALRRAWDDSPFRAELWDWVEALPAWKDRPRGAQTGRFRRGVGLAMASWFYIIEPSTQVKLRLENGELVAETGSQDIGNGGRSVVARAVEGILGIAPRVVYGDSDLVHGPLCGGSRGTASLAPAAEDAARQLAAELERWAARVRRVRNPEVGGGAIAHAKGSIAWDEVLKEAPRIEVVGRRKADRGGWYLPMVIGGTAFGRQLGVAIAVTEVEVDTRIGRVRATGAWSAVSAGRIVTPELARSQVQGSVVQGIGYALYEERRFCPRSHRMITRGLEDYRVAGIGDSPPVEVFFGTRERPEVEGGAIGLAEVATAPLCASVGNAVFAATGWRPTDIPIRPERVLAGVRA